MHDSVPMAGAAGPSPFRPKVVLAPLQFHRSGAESPFEALGDVASDAGADLRGDQHPSA